MITYVLENLESPLLPPEHYDAILNILLLPSREQQICSLKAFMRELTPQNKVILDRLFSTFNQILLACTHIIERQIIIRY